MRLLVTHQHICAISVGYCIDHIYAKESTIPQAGNGAFARYASFNMGFMSMIFIFSTV